MRAAEFTIAGRSVDDASRIRLLESAPILAFAHLPPIDPADVVPAQCCAARGGAISRRAAARAGRRRQRQDARDRREDRVSDRARLRSCGNRRDHVHQSRGARDARACGRASRQRGEARPRRRRRDLDVSRARPAHHPRRCARARLEARVLDPRSRRHRADRRRADRHHRRRSRAQHAAADQRVEERADLAGRCVEGGAKRRRSARRASVLALRRCAARLPRGRLRRPDRASDPALCGQRDRESEVARALRARSRRRVPGHEPGAIPALQAAGRRAGRIHGGRRRRPGNLRLARRIAREPRRAAHRLPVAQGREARAELSVHRAHPALGKLADREQPEAFREEPVERARPRRRDRHNARGRRRGRSRERRAAAACAPVRAPRPLQRLRDPLPRQPPGEAVRAAASRARHSVRGLRRPIVLRARRDQGRRRVSAAHRERRRRSGVHSGRHDAEARDRRDDARAALRDRRRAARRVFLPRSSPAMRTPEFPSVSATYSVRSAR